jgi:hypothetical protein
MFWNLTSTALCALAALAFLRYGRRALAWLKRFDAENRARIESQWHDRRDHNAHIRQTIEVAEEQVEEIVEITEKDARTGTPVKRFAFEGVWYASREEAEQVRAQKIGDIARGFYRDLPAALAARREGGKLN